MQVVSFISRRVKRLLLIAVLIGLGAWLLPAHGQIVTSSSKGQLPQTLIQDVLKGDGVYFLNGKFNWDGDTIKTDQIGTFTNGDAFSSFPFKDGIILCTGKVGVADGPNNSGSKTLQCAQSTSLRDPDLQAINPTSYFATTTVLEFDFMSTSSSFNFEYVFASEEYPEYVCSKFNDAFGFFLTGLDPVTNTVTTKNIAVVPGSVTDETPNGLQVAINTINPGRPGSSHNPDNCTSLDFSEFYVDNTGGEYVQFDGYTTALSAGADIVPCETYHMKISIANAQDNSFESGVFIKSSSFSSVDIEYIQHYDIESQQRLIEGCNDMDLEIKLAYPVDYDINIELETSGTATEGEDYEVLNHNFTIHAGETSAIIPFRTIQDDVPELRESVLLDINIVFCGIKSARRVRLSLDDLTSIVTGSVCDEEPFNYRGDVYTQPGTYEYHHTTSYGCDSLELLILDTKHCPCKVEFVNTFTPNDDGVIDYFGLELTEEFDYYLFCIYDRWGAVVFKTKDTTEVWDGKVNGQPVSDGVYYWTLNYACANDPQKRKFQQGSITLIR